MTQMFYRTLISSCSNSESSVPRTATYTYGSHCKFWFCWQLYKVRPSNPVNVRAELGDVLTRAEIPQCVSRFCSEKRVGHR